LPSEIDPAVAVHEIITAELVEGHALSAGQMVQVVAPVRLYEPLRHGNGLDDVGSAQYDPAGHEVHALAPPVEKAPEADYRNNQQN
jgi:hypothetical protein